MNLLRVSDEISHYHILSYHHGDPSKYRGRPAGFYEILNGEKSIEIIVQRLSNELDAGDVYAFAELKIINYSYKRTALNFYSISRCLLRKALVNLALNASLEITRNGNIYKLPGNFVVLKFIIKTLKNLFARIVYGGFYEKRWRVALSDSEINFEAYNFLKTASFQEIPILDKYNFYADPFFSIDDSKIRLEALEKQTGLGDILEIDVSDLKRQEVILTGKHYSYPFALELNGGEFLLPEVASHSPQYIYSVNKGVNSKWNLNGLENYRIVDATLHRKDSYWYLFFGFNHDAHTVLNLWISDDIAGEFKPHANSPICLSPGSARMGGNIILKNENIYRLGQNNEGEYGESLTILKITEITPKSYNEAPCGSISMSNFKDPHSLAINPKTNKVVLDYYNDQFSIFAGVRRLKAKFAKP